MSQARLPGSEQLACNRGRTSYLFMAHDSALQMPHLKQKFYRKHPRNGVDVGPLTCACILAPLEGPHSCPFQPLTHHRYVKHLLLNSSGFWSPLGAEQGRAQACMLHVSAEPAPLAMLMSSWIQEVHAS